MPQRHAPSAYSSRFVQEKLYLAEQLKTVPFQHHDMTSTADFD